jgi:serine protease Do
MPMAANAAVAVGRVPVKLPEFAQECLAYVPTGYDPSVPHGLLLWLHPPGGFTDDALVNRWQALCDQHDLILLAPRATNPAKWEASELEFIVKAVAQVRADYTIDPARITAAGQQAGGALAYVLAFQNRDVFRAVAAIDAPVFGKPVENDPAQPLMFYTASTQDSQFAEQIQAGIAQLKELKYSVAVKDLGTKGRDLNIEEIAELARWLDTLDRL